MGRAARRSRSRPILRGRPGRSRRDLHRRPQAQGGRHRAVRGHLAVTAWTKWEHRGWQRVEGRAPMPERNGYIPGVPCWVEASEPDPEAALDFYGGLFGWEFEDVMPPGSDGTYVIARGEARGSSIFDVSGAV